MSFAIRSTVDTWLKHRPVQSSLLSDDERTVLKARVTLPLAAYRVVGNHLLITFGKDAQGNQISLGGRNTWYAYGPVMEILRNATPVSPDPAPVAPPPPPKAAPAPVPVVAPQGYTLHVKSDTWIKASTAQGSSLPNSERAIVRSGQAFPIAAYHVMANHLKFTLGQTEQGQQVFVNGRNTWYVYEPAVEIRKDGKVIALKQAPAVAPKPAQGNAIPQAGIDLIKEFEGYADRLPDGRATAYPDPIYGWGVPTIGYGTIRYPNGNPVRQGDIITHAQAELYLVDHIEESTRPFLERIPTWRQMNENQRSALYSFAYNLGARFYGQSGFASITRVCDSPDRWRDAAWIREQFVKYRNPGSSAEAGLLRRREAEARLFVQGS